MVESTARRVLCLKTPEELVKELESVAADSSFPVHLFVAFEDSSILLNLYHHTETLSEGSRVYERDQNFLSMLKDAIANGGNPVGWYRVKTTKTAGDTVEMGVLEDHQNEPWAYEYLKGLCTSKDRTDGTRFYIVYPDGGVLDITEDGHHQDSAPHGCAPMQANTYTLIAFDIETHKQVFTWVNVADVSRPVAGQEIEYEGKKWRVIGVRSDTTLQDHRIDVRKL